MTKKYRPYFTLAELKEIESALAAKSSPLLTYISRYIRDIEDGFRPANYSLKPGISESLGFSSPKSDTRERDLVTLLDIFSVNKSYLGLTPAERKMLSDYRYENNLMSQEEEDSHVRSLFTAS